MGTGTFETDLMYFLVFIVVVIFPMIARGTVFQNRAYLDQLQAQFDAEAEEEAREEAERERQLQYRQAQKYGRRLRGRRRC